MNNNKLLPLVLQCRGEQVHPCSRNSKHRIRPVQYVRWKWCLLVKGKARPKWAKLNNRKGRSFLSQSDWRQDKGWVKETHSRGLCIGLCTGAESDLHSYWMEKEKEKKHEVYKPLAPASTREIGWANYRNQSLARAWDDYAEPSFSHLEMFYAHWL